MSAKCLGHQNLRDQVGGRTWYRSGERCRRLSGSTAQVLRYFLVRPDARPYIRELQRVLGLGGGSLQRTLKRLEEIGSLAREDDDGLVRYQAVWCSPAWTAARALGATGDEIRNLIENALADVDDLDAAFIFGSVAAGDSRADSDIDLFVLEHEATDSRRLLRQLVEVGLLLDRHVNATRYTPDQLAERLGDPGHVGARFVRDVLSGPKLWVAGQADVLRPLAQAAGLTSVALVA